VILLIVFKVLILVLAVIIWKLTYPKISPWINKHTSINVDKYIKKESKRKRRD
jgi:hypothetical protein